MFTRAVHPGEILKGELEKLGITPTAFARQIAVPPNRMSQIVVGSGNCEATTLPARSYVKPRLLPRCLHLLRETAH